MNGPRAIAVDWSGRAGADQKKTIYLAEVSRQDESLVRLESGRSRSEIVDLLIAEASADPNVVVGFDFAFSLPEWYLASLGLASAHELWARMASETLTSKMSEVGLVEWMRDPEPPFWAGTKAASGLTPDQEFRRTEQELRRPGMQPKSVFQFVGAGQVGRGSLYGMQALHRLSEAGFSIWPFDEPQYPLVLEIFPRVFSMGANKSNADERRRFLETFAIDGPRPGTTDDNEDAFDAAVAANAIAGASRTGELATLAQEPEYELEGRIWGLPKNTLSRGTPAAAPPQQLARIDEDSFWSAWIDEQTKDPAAWLHSARSLKRAADVLAPVYQSEMQAAMKLESPDDLELPPSVAPVYLMLAGFALECLAKGLIVAAEPSAPPPRRHLDETLIHNAGESLSDGEPELVRRLALFLTGFGRYPAPLPREAPKLTHSHILSAPMRFSTNDPNMVDPFYERLEHRLLETLGARRLREV